MQQTRGEIAIEWMHARWREGLTVYLTVYSGRSTCISAKASRKWREVYKREVVKPDRTNPNAILVASGKKYICFLLGSCEITAQ
ncbi:MAG: hypothetical protein OXC65_15895 [Thiotrichales bacterium]|nr:hypothetical protein [Thiotrichales bacterium]MCY4286809.1 hypothetical protein [Thiotrichales bacterium]